MADSHSTAELFQQLRNERQKFEDALLAKNTCKGYAYDFAAFERWCARAGVVSLPCVTETLSLYVTDLLSRGRKSSTAMRHAFAIVQVHRTRGFPSPPLTEIRRVLLGCKRLRGEQVDQVLPLTLAQLEQISSSLAEEDTPLSSRNRALMLLGFASALRTASLSRLNLEDVALVARGVELQVRGEKQDRKRLGRVVAIPRGLTAPLCPVVALEDWQRRRGVFPGPLFTRFDHNRKVRGVSLQPERIGKIVQQCCARIGLDPRLYGGHSLRAGFITEAGEASIGELIIAHHTGHSDMGTLRGYFRRTDAWKSNAAGKLGL